MRRIFSSYHFPIPCISSFKSSTKYATENLSQRQSKQEKTISRNVLPVSGRTVRALATGRLRVFLSQTVAGLSVPSSGHARPVPDKRPDCPGLCSSPLGLSPTSAGLSETYPGALGLARLLGRTVRAESSRTVRPLDFLWSLLLDRLLFRVETNSRTVRPLLVRTIWLLFSVGKQLVAIIPTYPFVGGLNTLNIFDQI